VVRRGLNVAVLAAVEAHGLGGLVVLLRAAGLDVVAAREGPRVGGAIGRGLGGAMAGRRKTTPVEQADPELLLSESHDVIVRETAALMRSGATSRRGPSSWGSPGAEAGGHSSDGGLGERRRARVVGRAGPPMLPTGRPDCGSSRRLPLVDPCSVVARTPVSVLLGCRRSRRCLA
jgi:hypothetical protein